MRAAACRAAARPPPRHLTQELRERVLRLNIELQQRAKWEAVRLAEVIAQARPAEPEGEICARATPSPPIPCPPQNEAQWVAQFDDFAAKAQEKAQRDAAAGLADAKAKMEVRADEGQAAHLCVDLSLPPSQTELLALVAEERRRIEHELVAEANAQLRASQQVRRPRAG